MRNEKAKMPDRPARPAITRGRHRVPHPYFNRQHLAILGREAREAASMKHGPVCWTDSSFCH
ncbi:uncharacterized protein BDZ83DRAFT_625668 [Colletotrichum acutatum]|uniref:Uncharacterized protein n=1 Tax=Glomerella acutata TaxID=27357 RepID=A0AAD8UIX6_GLOAC|nr:uncharacterized protein BDZ83DRAFT_625668 [Colletotrichum acutatum]KAK1723637.1 hypothetical protein BDZ83DRAFT_625668 [Colletotrichum acutatum]